MRRAKVLLSLVALTLFLLAGSPALAQGTDDVDALVVLTGRADVPVEEELETVVIFDGPATIEEPCASRWWPSTVMFASRAPWRTTSWRSTGG